MLFEPIHFGFNSFPSLSLSLSLFLSFSFSLSLCSPLSSAAAAMASLDDSFFVVRERERKREGKRREASFSVFFSPVSFSRVVSLSLSHTHTSVHTCVHTVHSVCSSSHPWPFVIVFLPFFTLLLERLLAGQIHVRAPRILAELLGWGPALLFFRASMALQHVAPRLCVHPGPNL